MLTGRRYIFSWSMMLMWTAVAGVYGFWLWFFSVFNGAT